MKRFIPAKTFLLGEYAALAGESAMVLTTTPSFAFDILNRPNNTSIHPDSPAGMYLSNNGFCSSILDWSDPYKGIGGMGASSAQFISAYLAVCRLKGIHESRQELLEAYYCSSWSGSGIKPSGYDVIAQSYHGCVFINKNQNQLHIFPEWPFTHLAYFIVHTGLKYATHEHLRAIELPKITSDLSSIVELGKRAFETAEEDLLIQAIQSYFQSLRSYNLVAKHTIDIIDQVQSFPEVLAIKGCGALGADTLIIITSQHQKESLHQKIKAKKMHILATENNLSKKDSISYKN